MPLLLMKSVLNLLRRRKDHIPFCQILLLVLICVMSSISSQNLQSFNKLHVYKMNFSSHPSTIGKSFITVIAQRRYSKRTD